MKKEGRFEMKLTRPKLSVGTKTFAALSVVFWVPVIALAGILFFLFQGLFNDEVLNSIKIELKGAKGVYEERLKVVEGTVSQLARRPDVVEAFEKKDGSKLKSLLLDFGKENAGIDTLTAVNETQVILGGNAEKPGEILNLGSIVSSSLQGGDTVSSIELVGKGFLNSENDKLNRQIKDVGIAQFVASPVRKGGKVLGSIVAGMFLTGDPWLGNTIHSRFGVEMALFAGETAESLLLHSTSSVPRNTWSIGQAIPVRLKEETSLGKPYYGVLDITGVDHLVAFEPLKDSRHRIIGAIGVSVPAKKVNSIVLWEISKGVLAVALIGLCVAIPITLIVHYDITRPLNLLTRAMDAFGRGEVATSIKIRTGDQFETLGKGFNQMADGIRKREEKLKKHNEVAKLLMSTLDLKELLTKMVNIAVAVTESHMGIAYLYDEGTKTLIPNTQHGTKADLPSIALGEGYPGKAAADKKIFIVKQPGAGHEVELGFASVAPREAAYIPLAYQDKVHGLLVLGSLDRYSEEDMHLFEYLANQISIALDNAILHQQVQELSITDALTGLANRRFLNLRLAEEWARAERHHFSLTVLLADIDNFKSINDTFGHDRGDEVLRAVSDIIKGSVRREDIASRFGGEEFVIVLAGTDTDEAYSLAERIRTQTASHMFAWMDKPVTVSIGVATYPDAKVASFEELIQAADQAMYKAKVTGKNRVTVSEGKVMVC